MTHSSLIQLAKKLSPFVPEMQETPLFGKASFFDWQKLSDKLQERLELDLSIRSATQSFKEVDQLYEGFGNDLWEISVLLTPLQSPVHLILNRSDLHRFFQWQGGFKTFSSEALQEGWNRFITLEMIDVVSKIPPLQTLSFGLIPSKKIQTHCFCVDLKIDYQEESLWARLFLTPSFQEEWKEHFANFPSEITLSPLLKSLELKTVLEIGSFSLSSSEWQEVVVGDWLKLSRKNYDPEKNQGLALVKVEGLALFQAQILPNRLEIIPLEEEMMEQTYEPIANESIEKEEEPESLGQIPLKIQVELAHFQMPLEKLLHLQPGSLLDLPLDPHQELTLSLNQKPIAKARLVAIGQEIGVQITKILRR